MRRLVSLYQFNLLEEEERFRVEEHLLDCDACFEEVYRMSEVSALLEQEPHLFLDAVQSRESNLTLVRKAYSIIITSLMEFLKYVCELFQNWIKIPAVRVLVPVTAAVLFILIVAKPFKKDFSRLAIIESASYIGGKASEFADEFSSAQTLYDQGMKYYQEKNYQLAIQKLDSFVRRKTDDPFGHFYLGVSHLMQNDFKNGVRYLEIAADLSQEQNNQLLLEKSNWYLANAYLKINEAEKAIKLLTDLSMIEGEYKEQSRNLLMKLSELRNE
ncbi:MAG: zf-HC2 domain-containing protein [candidate division KSB1 bacterium]|nr:zf-HC2 domain-containing protein [candidate division KSB1 bacterium]